MSSDAGSPTPTSDLPPAPSFGEADRPVRTGPDRSFWWIRLVLGLVAVLVGVLVMAWPEATVTVVAVLFGLNLLVDGFMRVLQAILSPAESVAARVLYGLLGIVSVVIGVLCLRNLLQTVAVLVLLVGLSWLIAGIIELVVALSSGPPSRWTARTALDLGTGVVALLAGAVVLAYPKVSLGTLVVLLGASLLVYGAVSIMNAFRLRSEARA
jgi:uncharacterized membrane protein HdeD (DUF308 family)